MNELFGHIISSLPEVATSPLSFLAYLAIIVAWLIIALKVKRNKQVLSHLKDLPSKDRLKALKYEMGTVDIKEGLTPEQYIRSKIHSYYFIGAIILFISIIIIFVVVFTDQIEQPSKTSVEIINLSDYSTTPSFEFR